MKPSTFLLCAVILLCVTMLAMLAITRPLMTTIEPMHRVHYGVMNSQLDDMLRRTCVIYKQRVADGSMKPGDPSFADCAQ